MEGVDDENSPNNQSHRSPLGRSGRRRRPLQPDEYPYRPVNARAGPDMPGRSMENVECIPINPKEPVPFETALFKGVVLMCIRNTPGTETDPWAEGERFAGKRRRIVLTIKGQFKTRLRQNEVFCGLVWKRPLVNLPWTFVLNAAENLIATLSPGAHSSIASKEEPHFLNFLIAGADTIHVTNEGDPPLDITAGIVPEKTEYASPKKRMEAAKHAAKKPLHNWAYWEVGPEYTFDFYGDKVDLVRFVAAIPTLPEFQLQKYFNKQPLPFIARTDSGEVLWQFEVWNEVLFDDVDGDMSGLGATVREDDELSESSFPPTPHDEGQASRHASFMTCASHGDDHRISIGTRPPIPSLQASVGHTRGRAWKKRLQIDKQRWAAWDEHLGDPTQPRPSDTLCAAAVAITSVILLAFVMFWWYDLVYERFVDSVSSVPSAADWGRSVAILVSVLIVGALVGQVTGFVRVPERRRIGKHELLQFLLAVCVSIPQEAGFRAIIIPYHHGVDDESKADGKSTVMWTVLSIVLFTAHFPVMATTCFTMGYPTFLDPRFLCLAVVVGVGCSSVYIITGSLWVSSLVNAVAWTSWLLFAGGAKRLRRVRIIVPRHGASYGTMPEPLRPSRNLSSPELYTPLHTSLVGTPRATPTVSHDFDDLPESPLTPHEIIEAS